MKCNITKKEWHLSKKGYGSMFIYRAKLKE